MLDDLLLHDFVHGFLGYGSFKASWWFVGMEEGGGNEEAEISRRLNAWDRRGRCELEDVEEFHRAFGVLKFWKEKPPVQRTWSKLIRLKLAAINKQPKEIAVSQIRRYQRDHWGKIDGGICLLELLPLPAPQADVWYYGNWTNLSQLSSRDAYQKWLLPHRIQVIQQRIRKHRPEYVVFYGKRYRKHWLEIAGDVRWHDDAGGFSVCKSEATTFLSVPHPASKWANSFWTNVGRSLV